MHAACEISSDHHPSLSLLFPRFPPRPFHFQRSQAQLLLLDSRQHARQGGHARGNHSPELYVQNILIESGLCRRRNRHKAQDQQDITAHPMILIDAPSIVRATEETGSVILSNADDGLEEEEDVGDETEDGVRRLEMCAAMGDLVVLDDNEGSDEGEYGG